MGKSCRYEPLQKPTQEKSPAEIIIYVVANDSSSDKGPKDIANDIIQLAKSVKTDANKVAASNILPRKDKFNNKAKEVNTYLQDICFSNNLPLITHRNINSHRHINVKSSHVNSYGDNQLTRNFINFIENGQHNFGISLKDLYPHQKDATTDRDELNNSFSADDTHDNLNQNFLLKTTSFRFENPKNVIVGHRNINSLRNKFELLKPFIYNAFDIFLFSETKINNSFPNSSIRLGLGYLDMIEIALEEVFVYQRKHSCKTTKFAQRR